MLTVLMPMAGFGNRFRDVGEMTPKPLIKIGSQPMFLEALSSLSALRITDINYIFVVRKEDPALSEIRKSILNIMPRAKLLELDNPTNGAAETCFMARDLIDPEESLLILDCDINFDSAEFLNILEDGKASIFDGALMTFLSNDPKYSYVEVEKGLAKRTEEKQAISSSAIIGAYFFKLSRIFFDSCHELLALPISNETPEYYVSKVYNYAIAKGAKFKVVSGVFSSFGTPEELELYLRQHTNSI